MPSAPPKYALIVAAGQGTRMRSAGSTQHTPKQFLWLGNKPVLQHSIDVFASTFTDIRFILVLPPSYPHFVNKLPSAEPKQFKGYEYPPSYFNVVSKLPAIYAGYHFAFVPGGETRFQSVKNGIQYVQEADAIVFVHDAARPLLTGELIERCYAAALEHGVAIPAVPATESLRGIAADGTNHPIDRQSVRYIQTPQTFRAALLFEAFQQDFQPTFTDEATVVEKAGHRIQLVEGDPTNIKLTYPHDMKIAEVLLRQRTQPSPRRL
ncbi:MAG: 2-C-methyl-D-erythritol 4-phosphate cytidylyltransferase [Thermoflavifilum sp.]|nr:2-C-methyl-D-erythritol 4-phosphate cytidylyltransferase [Thermoflavifilum sp.]